MEEGKGWKADNPSSIFAGIGAIKLFLKKPLITYRPPRFPIPPKDFQTLLRPCHVAVDHESVKTKDICIMTGTLTYPSH